MEKVIQFPQATELDKQFIELEKQQQLIKEQTALIKKEKKDKLMNSLANK